MISLMNEVSSADVARWAPLCWKIARLGKYARLEAYGFTEDDRFQVAQQGVLHALRDYDVARGAALKTHCWNHACWAIVNAMRQYGLKRHVVNSGDAALIARNQSVRVPRSLNQMAASPEEGGIGFDPVGRDADEPRETFEEILGHADLTEIEAAALTLLFLQDMCLREAGERLGVSHEYVRQRRNTALVKLRRGFARVGAAGISLRLVEEAAR